MLKIVISSIFLLITSISFSQNYSNEKVIAQADSLASLKEYEKAIDLYSDAIKKSSNNPIAYFNRALTYMAVSKYEKAIVDYTSIINLNINLVSNSYFNRGVCKILLNQNDSREGCSDLIKAKELGFEAIWADFSSVCPDIK